MEPSSLNVRFVNETDDIVAATNGWEASRDSADSDDVTDMAAMAAVSAGYRHGPVSATVDHRQQPVMKARPPPGKKTMGRVKIKMEYIKNKVRRYTTFSKRKTGIMKKAYELTVLTGTEVMLLVASETGHVYTFATRKLQPMITSENGKALIQTCLSSPDSPASEVEANVSAPSSTAAAAAAASASGNTETSDFSPVISTAANNHIVSIPQQLALPDHAEKLPQAQQIQVLNSFEEKIKSVQSADFSQYVGPHGSLPGTSAADAKNVAAVNLQHEQRTGTASASINAAVRSDQSEGPYFLKTPSAVPADLTSKRSQQQLYQIPGTKQIISLPVVTGSGVESGAGGAAVFYQMPEGYVLGVPPGTPAFALPPKVLPGHGDSSVHGAGIYNPVLVKFSAAEAVSSGGL